MGSRIRAALDELRGSYWFIPAMMAATALLLAFAITYADEQIDPSWIDKVPWLYGNKADGARVLLSTVAGSMIGVAGVTFSVTIASVVYASGQYGPRLLTNFMRDQGNQVTLGTFIATFLYCIMVLRTIRVADEGAVGQVPEALAGAFVPHISLAVAMLLTLASLAVLIFFIHHVPNSIRVSHVIAGIGEELHEHITKNYAPIEEGVPAECPAQTRLDAARWLGATAMRSTRVGYIQSVDDESLLALAKEHDLVMRIKVRPGDFVALGDTLALASPAENVNEELEAALGALYDLGKSRSGYQDMRFLFDELVEISARALSPAISDPYTAMTCMNWIAAALKQLATRDAAPDCADDDGVVRVITEPMQFEGFVRLAFLKLEPYVAADYNATLHAFGVIAEIGGRVTTPARKAVLHEVTTQLCVRAMALSTCPHERDVFRRRGAQTHRLLRSDHFDVDTIDVKWAAGSA